MKNNPLSESDVKRLGEFFTSKKGDAELSNYYIYALCDEGIPFYIGKGIGVRCLQHEDDLELIKKEYRRITPKVEMELLEDSLKQELTDKLARIEESKSKGTFDIVILKFGLTEHEAFMAESTAINTIKLCGCSLVNLTNKVNGHTSGVERSYGGTAKPRTIHEVLDECCPRVIEISDIRSYVGNQVEFDENNDDIAFISFNKSFWKCNNILDYWDAVRGCWRISKKNGLRTKYIFAMHNNVIKGIFKVKADGSKESSFEKIISARSNLQKLEGSNIHSTKTEWEMDLISLVIKANGGGSPQKKDFYKEELDAINSKYKDNISPPNVDENFLDRGFFACDYKEYEHDPDLLELRTSFLNCSVSDIKIPQGSIKMLSNVEFNK